MHNLVRPLGGLVAAALLVAACGGAPAPTPEPATPAPPAGVVLEVTATEFEFDPSALSASAGADVTIRLTNGGIVEHDFVIDDLGVMVHAAVGETQEGTIRAVAAGTYDFYCSIPGHKEAGMVGTLEVK